MRIQFLKSRTYSQVYSTIDLASGYYQIKIVITNACGTFQRHMNTVLDGLIGKCSLVYLDDIIIFSNKADEHLGHVKLVAERLRQYNLKIKLTKCKFAQTSIEYLSHIIGGGEIKPNSSKMEALYCYERLKKRLASTKFSGSRFILSQIHQGLLYDRLVDDKINSKGRPVYMD